MCTGKIRRSQRKQTHFIPCLRFWKVKIFYFIKNDMVIFFSLFYPVFGFFSDLSGFFLILPRVFLHFLQIFRQFWNNFLHRKISSIPPIHFCKIIYFHIFMIIKNFLLIFRIYKFLISICSRSRTLQYSILFRSIRLYLEKNIVL